MSRCRLTSATTPATPARPDPHPGRQSACGANNSSRPFNVLIHHNFFSGTVQVKSNITSLEGIDLATLSQEEFNELLKNVDAGSLTQEELAALLAE